MYSKEQVVELLKKQRELCAEAAEVSGDSDTWYPSIDKDSILNAPSPELEGEEKHLSEEIEYNYQVITIEKRLPDLKMYINDKLILLDEYYDVLKVVPVGMLTEWDAVKGNAEYWLEKTEL